MNLFISTVSRPGGTNYLKRCIESIRQDWDDPIHLMIGGKDWVYLEGIDDPFLEYHYVNEKGLKDNIQKAAKGYFDCLTFNKTQPCLILEDDAVLEKDWYTKLQILLDYIKDERYILSLLSPSPESVMEPNIDIPSVQRYVYHNFLTYTEPGVLPTATIVTYSNTTGIYYPASVLQTRLSEFIYEYAVKDKAIYDIVLGQFMFRYNLPIYIVVPNLLKFNVDSKDSSLGSIKAMPHIDYSEWDFTKL